MQWPYPERTTPTWRADRGFIQDLAALNTPSADETGREYTPQRRDATLWISNAGRPPLHDVLLQNKQTGYSYPATSRITFELVFPALTHS
jgi:hypothetical protein